MLYTPSAPVLAVWVNPVSMLRAVTMASGTEAPEGSLTVPRTAPRSWANPAAATQSSNATVLTWNIDFSCTGTGRPAPPLRAHNEVAIGFLAAQEAVRDSLAENDAVVNGRQARLRRSTARRYPSWASATQ